MKTDKVGNYFLGLDIGTNSVGWAATDENYDLLKYKNHSMWGVHLFDEGTDSKERRAHRTARRRLQRRKQRIALLQDLFKEEISKVDPRFYIRLKESALLREDKTDKNNTNTLFNDLGFTDKEFYKKYPTIHHLISAQIDGEEQSLGDIRLVYLSCAWLLKNRGHFLNDLDVDNVDKLNDFNELYSNFEAFFESNGYDIPWH
jgi:CRISPR-associated endonuclease Csn1